MFTVGIALVHNKAMRSVNVIKYLIKNRVATIISQKFRTELIRNNFCIYRKHGIKRVSSFAKLYERNCENNNNFVGLWR